MIARDKADLQRVARLLPRSIERNGRNVALAEVDKQKNKLANTRASLVDHLDRDCAEVTS